MKTLYLLLCFLVCFVVIAQEFPPTPRLELILRNEPPHVDMKFSVTGDTSKIEAFRIIRRILVDGTLDGPIVMDQQKTAAADKLKRSFVASKNLTTWTYVDKKLPPNTKQIYLYSVVALGEDGESAESNKIELHP